MLYRHFFVGFGKTRYIAVFQYFNYLYRAWIHALLTFFNNFTIASKESVLTFVL